MLKTLILHKNFIIILGIFSIITFVGTLLLIPIILIHLPSHYFTGKKRKILIFDNHHKFLRLMLIIFKNILGVLFILTGIILLFIPGQGLLTILVGILFLDFPGKYKIEKILIQNPSIFKTVNRIRQKVNRIPFEKP